MRKRSVFALVLALAFAATANASALTVGFSQVGAESDWRTANTIDLVDAVKAEGWTLVYEDAQCKEDNQIMALRNFIGKDVDYILFTGVVLSGWEEVLKDVRAAGIPLILIDRIPDRADEIGYAAVVVNDHVEQGRRMAYWTINHMERAGRAGDEIHIAVLEGITGAHAQIGRNQGIDEVLSRPEYANFKIVASQAGNFTRDEGRSAMASILKSVGRVDVLLSHNDDMALGAIEAIKDAGLKPGVDIVVVGCEAIQAALDAVAAGEMNATIESTPMYGRYVVEAIKAMEAGGVYDRAVIHPEEGCFDMEGGVVYSEDGRLSVRAADVTGWRGY